MGRADRTLYTSIRRIVQQFYVHKIPFMGPAGTDLVCWNLDPISSLQSWFRHPAGAIRFEGLPRNNETTQNLHSLYL